MKFEASQVGRPVLQRLVGARGRHTDTELLVFTGAGYSKQAVEYAREMDIALFAYRLDGTMVPANRVARQVTSRVYEAHLVEERTREVSAISWPPATSVWSTLPWKGLSTACYILAAFFVLGFVAGLFNSKSFESASSILSGLSIAGTSVAFIVLGNWARRLYFKYHPQVVASTGN